MTISKFGFKQQSGHDFITEIAVLYIKMVITPNVFNPELLFFVFAKIGHVC